MRVLDKFNPFHPFVRAKQVARGIFIFNLYFFLVFCEEERRKILGDI